MFQRSRNTYDQQDMRESEDDILDYDPNDEKIVYTVDPDIDEVW